MWLSHTSQATWAGRGRPRPVCPRRFSIDAWSCKSSRPKKGVNTSAFFDAAHERAATSWPEPTIFLQIACRRKAIN